MSLYGKLVASVLFPLHEAIKGHSTLKAYKAMEREQWLSPVEIEAMQVEQLRKFLVKIGTTVPYFKNMFDARDFDPLLVTSISDLQNLPLMDKTAIRNNTEELKAEGAGELKRFNTGGSSGEPLIFYLGTERVSHDVAAKRRATRWWGVDIGDPEIVVWGSPIEIGSQDRVRLVRDKLFRTELISAFEMSEENLERFVLRIMDCRPKMLFGYPSSLSLIASYAEKNGYTMNTLGIEVAFVTSERLYDHQRSAIEQVFGCPVANGYGGRDAGFIAHQCPEGSMHVTSDDIVLEIIDAEGCVLPVGERGEIVVTHMRTGDFPFVRYRTGDIGLLGGQPCACGRGLQILQEIEGRTTDFIYTADGKVLHGLALIYVLRDIEEVHSFKIVQEAVDHFIVQLVTNTEDTQVIEQLVISQFEARLGSSIHVDFEYYAEIPSDPSGKFRYVVSRVTPQ